ncbi:MAG TPA: hypothetical protein VGQ81_07855, partial [Acidobacteriota bacterium]|nr:hypothetical protein [Acidobacteriota bacterium]
MFILTFLRPVKSIFKARFVLLLLFVLAMLSLLWSSTTLPKRQAVAVLPEGVRADDHHVNIPYFIESEGMSSILTLNNNLPEVTTATVTIFNRKGNPLAIPPIPLAPLSPVRFSLKQLTSTAAGDFSSGNIEISYSGPSMAVTSQVSVVSERLRFSIESLETEAMEFASAKLDGILWLPDSSAQAGVALSNTATKALTVTVSATQQPGKKARTVTLNSRETRVIDPKDFLEGKVDSTPALITLEHNGQPGDVIATGFVLNPANGFSSNLNFIDRSTTKSSRLAGAHFRFGAPDPKEGFPPGTKFLAPLVLANAEDSATDARLFVDYTVDSQSRRVEIGKILLGPKEIRQIDLSQELARKGIIGPVKDAGVDISYSGMVGSVIARLVSMDS